MTSKVGQVKVHYQGQFIVGSNNKQEEQQAIREAKSCNLQVILASWKATLGKQQSQAYNGGNFFYSEQMGKTPTSLFCFLMILKWR